MFLRISTSKRKKVSIIKKKKKSVFHFKATNGAKILSAQDKMPFFITQSVNRELRKVNNFYCHS